MTHRNAAILAIVGGAMMVIGSFMPWLSARTGLGSISVAGTDGDGVFTLLLGGAAALIALVHLDRPIAGFLRGGIVLAGAIGVVVAVVDYTAASERISGIDSAAVAASVGAGLYIVGLGAVATALGGLRMDTASKPPPEPPEPPAPREVPSLRIDQSDGPEPTPDWAKDQ